MARIIHARLDPRTEQLFGELEQLLGWNDSEIVREAIKTLYAVVPRGEPRKIVGLGQFCSGKPDLGSDKKHLDGFGE